MSGIIYFTVTKKKKLLLLYKLRPGFFETADCPLILQTTLQLSLFYLVLNTVAYYEQKSLIVPYVTFCLTGGNEEWLLCLWISQGAEEDNKK